MYDITVVFTRHECLGKCNSNELYKIIEYINPGVIFEEIPPIFFNFYYFDKSCSNLETETINKYIKNHSIDHIPVDSDNHPTDKFFKDYKYLVEKLEGLADINGFTLRSLFDQNKIYIERYGFNYLNSMDSMKINHEITIAIENSLQKLNNDTLIQIFKLWKDTHEMRENHMLKNIYDYSKKHSYERAIFMIGAAHSNSIIEKISKFKKDKPLKLNWILEKKIPNHSTKTEL